MLVDVFAVRDVRRATAAIVYAIGLLSLYFASTSYHCCPIDAPSKGWMRRIDHAAIYVFIAASYTPVFLVPLRGAWGWSLWASCGCRQSSA